ncbi:MAG: hypothetical protein ACK5OX_18800 [Desertimonas sp.]
MAALPLDAVEAVLGDGGVAGDDLVELGLVDGRERLAYRSRI